jgi:5'-methylthioadenosine phosphorylase
MSEPYCSQLRKVLLQESESLELTAHSDGVYAMMKGPRFESPAEIEALKRLGADVVGMTNVPEVVLARELGMCYATVTVITNYAAGMQERITHEEVTEMFDRCINSLKTLLKRSIKSLPAAKQCSC